MFDTFFVEPHDAVIVKTANMAKILIAFIAIKLVAIGRLESRKIQKESAGLSASCLMRALDCRKMNKI